MQEDRIPKIFISYSWSSDWLVVPLAERLVSHGVDVILDKWDLKEGQDKYTFKKRDRFIHAKPLLKPPVSLSGYKSISTRRR